MERLLTLTCVAVMFSATLSAAQYDRLLDAIYVPDGAYFDTGYVVKDHPRVIADVSPDTTTDFDVFGVKPRAGTQRGRIRVVNHLRQKCFQLKGTKQ